MTDLLVWEMGLNEVSTDYCSLDLPSLERVILRSYSFDSCDMAIFESICFLWFAKNCIQGLDLPKLRIISYCGEGYSLAGYCEDERETMINDYESYDNTLIMKGMRNV